MYHLAETADKRFVSHAPGHWPEVDPNLWNDWKWQLKNRVTTLDQLAGKIDFPGEGGGGWLCSGNKLPRAVPPQFCNRIDPADPDCPIRRQMIPGIEESVWS